MITRLILIAIFGCLLSACSSAQPECTAIRSERWPIDPSWLLKPVDPTSLAADAELRRQFREGDQIWSYRAPERMNDAPMAPMTDRDRARHEVVGRYPRSGAAALQHRGYVLLRGCEAVHVVPSNPNGRLYVPPGDLVARPNPS